MVLFDLREEARLVSQFLYLVCGGTLILGAAALMPASLRHRLPGPLADAVRPLALVFAAASALVVWAEVDERRKSDHLIARCYSGGCTVTEGRVHSVEPVHQIGSGGRMTPPIRGGYFAVGDRFYAHYPRDVFSRYSPANRLRDGDWARVISHGDTLVLVEVVEPPAVRR